jgi:hypothetical protein
MLSEVTKYMAVQQCPVTNKKYIIIVAMAHPTRVKTYQMAFVVGVHEKGKS